MGLNKERRTRNRKRQVVKHPCVQDPDRELLQFNVRLAKARQAQADTNRIERKAFREHARVENAVTAYARELCARLEEQLGSAHGRYLNDQHQDLEGRSD